MHLHFQKLTPLLYGMPVSRDRCYMAGVSLQLVHEALEHEESVDDLFDTIYQCLQGNMPRMDIDSFLYPSDHKFVLDQAAKTKSEIEKRHTSKASQRSCGDGKRGAQKRVAKACQDVSQQRNPTNDNELDRRLVRRCAGVLDIVNTATRIARPQERRLSSS